MISLGEQTQLGRLKKLLSRAHDEDFLQLIWAVHALQHGNAGVAGKYIKFPQGADSTKPDSKLIIHDWELETLTNRLLVTAKNLPQIGKHHVADSANFNTLAAAINYLRKIDDKESARHLNQANILDELHRIGHQQFRFQEGYFNVGHIYRYGFLYGLGECGTRFQEKYAIPMSTFLIVGMLAYVALQSAAFVHLTLPANQIQDLAKIGITQQSVDAALSLMALPISKMRAAAGVLASQHDKKFGCRIPSKYRPSVLRSRPVIRFGTDGERLRAPLPELVIQRVTSGVFYDIIAGDDKLRNDASARFEGYCKNLIAKFMPNFAVHPSFQYGPRGRKVGSPDILVTIETKLLIAVECKSTRLSFAAQFSDDPFEEQQKAYAEIAKGVFQLWRFFSHCRRGIVDQQPQQGAFAIVLTLDHWLSMAPQSLRSEVFQLAHSYADDEGSISDDDRRAVIFAAISDFELLLATTNEIELLNVLQAAHEDRFDGWQLPSIRRDLLGKPNTKKQFPFSLAEVLPAWQVLDTHKANIEKFGTL